MLTPLREFFPALRHWRETAFPALARIDEQLRQCSHADAATAVLDRAKPDLCARLQARLATPAAQALTLKVLNLFLARFHFRIRSPSVRSRPFGLVVDPSNACRLACPGCVHSVRNRELRVFDWPTATLKETCIAGLLERYGPFAIGVDFYNYGEPLLNLNTPKFIRLAKSYLAATTISTSLSVQRFDAAAYVDSGLDFMALSIDGATQPVYQRFRRNGDLELVLENIRKLVEAKARLGKRTPVLCWKFLAFEHNVHEIPMAASMARKLGVNEFRVDRPFDVSWDDPEIRPAAANTFQPGIQRLDRAAVRSKPGNWNPFPEDLQSEAIARSFASPWNEMAADDARPTSGHTCHWLYKNIVMDAAGRILPCCGAPGPSTNLVFGNWDGGGNDPFNSEKYRQARTWFAGRSLPEANAPHCVRCEWEQTKVYVGRDEVQSYFKIADKNFFDRRSRRILSEW
jgi:MoaA/NifB/PqqE/SkfB family radical SAM enzyme